MWICLKLIGMLIAILKGSGRGLVESWCFPSVEKSILNILIIFFIFLNYGAVYLGYQ